MLNNTSYQKTSGARPVFTPKSADRQTTPAGTPDNKVIPIDAEKLKAAAASPGAFMHMLKVNRAPLTIFRVSDTQLRCFHANVRSALEVIEAAADGEALIEEMRKDTKLPKKTAVSALLLYTLGHYDLKRADGKKARDAYFWARDKGVQCYLAENEVTAAQTADTIKSLRGVHLTYTTWTSTRKGRVSADKKPRSSFIKSVREAIRDLGEGAEVSIRASVGKAGKLTLVEVVPVSAEKFV